MILAKPIIFFDLETTGIDVSKARIVEIACIKIDEEGNQTEKYALINPTIPIPIEASNVHGITDEKVKDKPTFQNLAKSLYSYFENCDIGGFNSDDYDIPILVEEFARCGILFGDWNLSTVDVLKIERKLRPNKLTDVYKRYTGKELDGAHNALNDVRATLEILLWQYKDKDEVTVEQIQNFYRNNKRYDLSNKMYLVGDVVYWSFGKNKDEPIENDLNYISWVMKQNSFSLETKTLINRYLKSKKG